MKGLKIFRILLVSAFVLSVTSFSLSYELEDIEKWLLEYDIPVYSGAYEIERKPGIPILYKKISYKVKVDYPSKEVLSFYNDLFAKEGWEYTDKGGVKREWVNYMDSSRKDFPEYVTLNADWIDSSQKYIIHLHLKHVLPVSTGEYSKEEEVLCAILPSWTYPEPEDFPVSEITIKNMTGEDIVDIFLYYNDKRKTIGNIANGGTKTVLNESSSDISFDLNYSTVIYGVTAKYSLENLFHIQARGQHIVISLTADGGFEEEMQFSPPKAMEQFKRRFPKRSPLPLKKFETR